MFPLVPAPREQPLVFRSDLGEVRPLGSEAPWGDGRVFPQRELPRYTLLKTRLRVVPRDQLSQRFLATRCVVSPVLH